MYRANNHQSGSLEAEVVPGDLAPGRGRVAHNTFRIETIE
jgi:hypothetical protein